MRLREGVCLPERVLVKAHLAEEDPRSGTAKPAAETGRRFLSLILA